MILLKICSLKKLTQSKLFNEELISIFETTPIKIKILLIIKLKFFIKR
jgi:hypothetical protein